MLLIDTIRNNNNVDNLGYKYYKNNLLINRICLICEKRKNPRGLRYLGSASISKNDMDNRLSYHPLPYDQMSIEVPHRTTILTVFTVSEIKRD